MPPRTAHASTPWSLLPSNRRCAHVLLLSNSNQCLAWTHATKRAPAAVLWHCVRTSTVVASWRLWRRPATRCGGREVSGAGPSCLHEQVGAMAGAWSSSPSASRGGWRSSPTFVVGLPPGVDERPARHIPLRRGGLELGRPRPLQRRRDPVVAADQDLSSVDLGLDASSSGGLLHHLPVLSLGQKRFVLAQAN
jgi:hypothetical protein